MGCGTMMALCLLVTVYPSLTAGQFNARHFMRFTSNVTWNQAREECSANGMAMGLVNRYSTAFLLNAFAREPQHDTNDIWIGMRDAAQLNESLGYAGFIWIKCKPFHWSNWAPGEPTDRWNNWCVRLLHQENLKWQPEQCLATAHFLCNKGLGPCIDFVDSEKAQCDIPGSPTLKPVVDSNATSDASCRNVCIEHMSYRSRCWMYTYDEQEGCVLHVGLTQIHCHKPQVPPSSEESEGFNSSVRWVRRCFTVSYNNQTSLDDRNYTSPFALDNCPLHMLPEDTSTASDTTQQQMTTSLVPYFSSSAPNLTPSSAAAVTETTTEGSPWSDGTTDQGIPDTTVPENNQTSLSPSPNASSLPPPPPTSSLPPTSPNASQSPTPPPTPTPTPTTPPPPQNRNRYCCRCFLRPPGAETISKETTEATTRELRRRLTLNKSLLSASRRRKKSAPDSRPSALATGGVGIAVLVLVLCLVVGPDLLELSRRVGLLAIER